jgi:hypothetical protein
VAQTSGPIAQGTTAERQFSDVLWRDRFGDEPGVIADYDGSAYKLNLPSDTTDVIPVGSATQASLAVVAGFVHKIGAGTPESITIPDASGSSRTDIISLRYDPAYTGAPGPVRLFRIAGTSAAIPTYDAAPPGVEDLPLWAVTRAPGQNLNLATVTRMFPRMAPSLEIGTSTPLPTSSPLGTTIRQGSVTYRRVIGGGGVPVWQADNASVTGLVNEDQSTAAGSVNGTTLVTIMSITAVIPDGIPAGKQIEILGTSYLGTASGVGAGITINGGTQRTTIGNLSGDMTAVRYDPSLTPGSRTYNLQVRSTVASQSVTWRLPYMKVSIV